MITAFDVRYFDGGGALAAAVLFDSFGDSKSASNYKKKIVEVNDYVPGSFYKRELPCILELFNDIQEPVDVIIIDGYVNLGDRPGLGAHLYDALDSSIPVIGVAKTYFEGSSARKVYRGKSKQPLFVTAIGMDENKAVESIQRMSGENRIPTLLKEVDRLTRE